MGSGVRRDRDSHRDGFVVYVGNSIYGDGHRLPHHAGPYVKVQSADTLHRLLAYLGTTPAQLAAFDEQQSRCDQGAMKLL
jgi:hypothetical protein